MNKNEEMVLKQQVMQLTQGKQYQAASVIAKKLVKNSPKDIEVWHALAQLQTQMGEYADAVRSYYQVCQGPSPFYMASMQRAIEISVDHGLWQLGLAPAKKMAEINPDSASANFLCGECWFHLGQYFSAEPYYLRAMALASNNLKCIIQCARLYNYIGRVDEAVSLFKQALKINADEPTASASLNWCHNFLDGVSEELVMDAHFMHAKRLESKFQAFTDHAEISGSKKLRIGFCSQDFYRHSVSYYVMAIFKHFPRNKWEVFCYSSGVIQDEVTEEIKSCVSGWRDCSAISDQEMSAKIKADEVDILIDLVGYLGRARFEVFALKPAPIQVTYLGYPNTTGLTRMDYRLTDEWSDPVQEGGRYYSEKLMRLKTGFLCFQPEPIAPEVTELFTGSTRSIVFGAFNVFQKISPRNFKLWSSILLSTPNSSLLIKSKPLGEEKLQEYVWNKFESYGVDKSRVTLMGWTENRDTHLAIYDDVAIHLDTFPYNGTTTTCEALWQGVPTVTLAGDTHRSRVGVSLMHQMGLQDWVAHSDQEYVDIAVAKAADLESLNTLRLSMRDRMASSTLMDGEGFVKELDRNFRLMVDDYNQKHANTRR